MELHRVQASGVAGAAAPDASRVVPRQRDPRATRRVTTFWDGGAWTYRVEGEAPLGHRYADPEPALAGGRYLAKTLGAEHVVENQDGSVRECVDCGEVCACHRRDGTSPGD